MLIKICLYFEELESVSKLLKYPCYSHSIWEFHKANVLLLLLLLHSIHDSTKME